MPKQRQYKERKLALPDAVSEAFGEITSLAEEMREAFDNTPESLQQSGAGEARGEAADALENISEVEVPELLAKFEVTLTEPVLTPKQMMSKSRSARLGDATDILDMVISHLNELAEDKTQTGEVMEAAGDLASELEDAKNEAENVSFPGMYG